MWPFTRKIVPEKQTVLKLNKGDVIVLTYKCKFTDKMFERLRFQVQNIFPDNKIMIVEDNPEIFILSKGE